MDENFSHVKDHANLVSPLTFFQVTVNRSFKAWHDDKFIKNTPQFTVTSWCLLLNFARFCSEQKFTKI